MATWLTLLLLASLVAYASNRFSLQSVSLALIGTLAVLYAFLPGTPAPTQAFTGFASEALVAIVGLMVLGRVLIMTGAMSPVSLLLSGALEHYPKAAFAAVLLGGFAMSGFLNDTPVVLLLIPLLVGAAERAGSNAARMLLPMNYAVILGGMMTAIGTSTNLLVSALSGSAGGPRFGFFDFYLIALGPAAVGLVYLIAIAPRILGDREQAQGDSGNERYLASERVHADGSLVGQTLHAIGNRIGRGASIRHLLRDGRVVPRLPTLALRPGDLLVLAGNARALHDARDALGLPEREPSLAADASGKAEAAKESRIVRRCIVSADSPVVGSSVRASSIESRFDVAVRGLSEAVSSAHTNDPNDIRFMPIGAGDSLLIEGSEDAIANACRWLSLVAVGEPLRRRAGREATIALIVFALVIVLAISKLVPIAVAAVLGVLACVVAGIADWEEIESAVEWRIVLIVASSIALGDALVSSGAMSVVAARLAEWTASWPLTATIAAVITATGLLTNFVSNNAAAAIMTPLGLQLATQLGAQPEAFVLGVLFGANLCFLTPMAYQTNLLVMAAGEYRFSDYVKVGLPLFALMVPLLALALGYGFT